MPVVPREARVFIKSIAVSSVLVSRARQDCEGPGWAFIPTGVGTMTIYGPTREKLELFIWSELNIRDRRVTDRIQEI